MKTVLRSLIVSAILVLIAIAVAVWLYPHLPLRVPDHWNGAGQATGYAPRFWAAAMWPLVMVGIAVMTIVYPAISPRRFEITTFARVYVVLMLAVQGLVLVIGVTMLLAAAGYAVSVPMITTLAVGVLFMVLGNYMGKLRKNFFIGIRTPWTLASSAVWERTHRLGGWLFVAAGVASIIGALVGTGPQVLAWSAVAAGAMAYVYSYLIYRRLDQRHQLHGGNNS